MGWFGADRDGWFARGGLRGREVVGEVGFGLAFVEVVLSADLAGDGREAVAVRSVDKVCFGEAAVVVICQVREIFSDEGQPGWARAGFEEQGMGSEEAGSGSGSAGGDGIDRGDAVVDAREERRAEDSGVEAGDAELAEGGEAQVGAWGAGFQLAG